MKYVFCLICCLITVYSISQVKPLVSQVYTLNNAIATSSNKGSIKKIFSGSGNILAIHEMKLVTLAKRRSLSYKPDNHFERFFIIQSGTVKAKLNTRAMALGRGSVITVEPGDRLSLENTGDIETGFYEMSYRSIAPPDAERGKKAGGSFIVDWNAVTFKPHDKGGVRQLFDRQTTMLNRFDIHVTTLNTGNKSHDPHTHKNEEIILMLEGNAEMQIGTDHQKANAGDVVFLGSMVLHNLTNVGTTPCLYFAIQWN